MLAGILSRRLGRIAVVALLGAASALVGASVAQAQQEAPVVHAEFVWVGVLDNGSASPTQGDPVYRTDEFVWV